MTPTGKYACLIVATLASATVYGIERIANSKHDLSVHSPSSIRAVDQEEICIFCHTPHNAKPQTPLWNRHSPTTHYRIYRSSTTDARIDQPSGPSKMCLSCHDGSLALGLVLSRPATDPITMTTHMLGPGPANLTNDLSDDHPIGFRYDRALRDADPQLRDPLQISRQLDLGVHSEVHCTTCHDPHNNELGDFLRVPVRRGVLCTTCHKMRGWPLSSHARSPRNIRSALVHPSVRPAYASMADNACLACHKVHNAARRERLLKFRQDEQNCVVCHDGTVASDVKSLVHLPSAHHSSRLGIRHDPTEFFRRVTPNHVECVDCHNAHAANAGRAKLLTGSTSAIVGPLRGAPGVTVQNRLVLQVRREHEVCLRCHGDNPVRVDTIDRVRPGMSLRRQIALTAASSHPFVLPRSSSEVPSLRPDLRGKRMNCSDCHNSNNARAFGGTSANGPHGSIYDHILAFRYEARDFSVESASAYALCYRCHERAGILGDQSFSLHRRHIVDARSPCSACHDPHGVTGSRTNFSHLINFDRAIVTRTPLAPRIEYRDLGLFQGSCTLQCHGVNHVNFIYTPTSGP